MIKGYLGIDVGSVSTKVVLLSEHKEVLYHKYTRTLGEPVKTVLKSLAQMKEYFSNSLQILGAGSTGSAREMIKVLLGADIAKNEITAHAVAATAIHPDVKTILEIGGQDSKVIIVRDSMVRDFAMNTVCAAGTGSFLDQQALRLSIPIEEFGSIALSSKNPVRIAGRCTIFAESDMIHKQQTGHTREDILAGLCRALVANYLNNVCRGKELLAPVMFIGGVAANIAIRKYFELELKKDILVPEYFNVFGAIGAALLAREEVKYKKETSFKGIDVSLKQYKTTSFECNRCDNKCEITKMIEGDKVLAYWGDRCQRWQVTLEPVR